LRCGFFSLTEHYILYICFAINAPRPIVSVKSPILQVLPGVDHSFSLRNVALFIHLLRITDSFLRLQVNEATVEHLVQQYPHITFSTVLQDCKRTLERAYQMGWTPNMSTAS